MINIKYKWVICTWSYKIRDYWPWSKPQIYTQSQHPLFTNLKPTLQLPYLSRAVIWLHSAAFFCISDIAFQEIPVVKRCEVCAYWKPWQKSFSYSDFFLKNSLRLWKTWYLKHLMAHSYAHAKLDFDLQIHNLLIRLDFGHNVLVMRLSIKPCESPESKTLNQRQTAEVDCFLSSSPFPSLLVSHRSRGPIHSLHVSVQFYFIFSYKHFLCFI